MQHTARRTWWVLAAVLLLPLISMAIVPLYDTSEPRYADIARMMAASGDWITPWYSPGVPFWGKPPLSFWAQALSIKTFGLTEFAARFPSWLCLLACDWVLFAGIRPIYGKGVALSTILIYSTCTLVYVSSGAVLTDPFLALGTTICLVSFALSTRGSITVWWRYGFFIGLAIGLLAKGPLAAVLSLAPIVVWKITQGKRLSLSRSPPLPWRRGLLLTAALTLPWYVLAEMKTPGFLNYFIVGEHLRRFLDPGWLGDLYGSAHKRVYGTIWWYCLQASFPWGVMVLAALLTALRNARVRAAVRAVAGDSLFGYWLAAMLITPCFFTFSANILWTYVLPALAGFSILTALFIQQLQARRQLNERLMLTGVFSVPVIVLTLSLAIWAKPDVRNTERTLVQFVDEQPGPRLPLFYLAKPPFSAEFYSAGRAKEISRAALHDASLCGQPFYLAVPKDSGIALEEVLGTPFNRVYANRRHVLVKIFPEESCGLLVRASTP